MDLNVILENINSLLEAYDVSFFRLDWSVIFGIAVGLLAMIIIVIMFNISVENSKKSIVSALIVFLLSIFFMSLSFKYDPVITPFDAGEVLNIQNNLGDELFKKYQDKTIFHKNNPELMNRGNLREFLIKERKNIEKQILIQEQIKLTK